MVASAALVLGCNGLFGPGEAQCSQSTATVRQAIGFQDFDSARKWRDYVWEVCADVALLASLDAEIVEAEKKAGEEADKAQEQRLRKLAQARINAAQKHWIAYDSRKDAARDWEALDAARAAAKRQEEGLSASHAKELSAYNSKQYDRRAARLKK